MRKQQFDGIKKMVEILTRAHEGLYKALSTKKLEADMLDSISDLLTGCQATAINIGNLIEESEGEGGVTVSYLEDYCEMVYSVNEEVGNSTYSINPDKINKKLNKMLLKIENSLKHDIPLKREAVFLPYKASMWDSLESVWEAADADPDCDAYVIPIPYYDKNPDGSVREEHYEADLFPEDVPITHYSEYDFGKHHPDMIFIHNPYDYGNLVTTIHPFFYAENMKKVTDCLVYIPYFATSGAMSESRAWCPVYDYVDYIVIQHESYRKYYSADIPDEKFLPLGSPKFDKVIRKCQNPPELSEDWKKRINGRRVFFYNTSLNGMLDNTPQFLRKMQYVFETFKEHPDCCLLWRPHPLFESTLHAMRPECIEVFDALKRDFFKQDNWIYDDTPSVEDTIAICDYYIGDSASSIVALFGVAGKPIFILDNSIIKEAEITNVSRLLLEKKNIDIKNNVGTKFAITEENVLYWSKANDYKYERYLDFSNSILDSAYSNIYKYDNDLVITPCMSQEVVIIDEKKNIDYITLEDESKAIWAFEESYLINNKLVLVPHDYSRLVIVNLDNKNVEYLDVIQDFYRQLCSDGYHYGSSWVAETYIYITDSFCNKYIKINIENKKIEVFEIGLNIESKRIVNFEGSNECWIIHVEGPYVTRLDYKTHKSETINLSLEGLKSNSVLGSNRLYFDNIVKMDDRLLFSPLFSNMIVELNLKNKKVKEIVINCAQKKTTSRRFGYFVNNECVFYYLSSGNCYDLTDSEVKEIKIEFNEKEVLEDLKKFKRFGDLCRYCNREKDLNLLKDYIENIKDYSFDKEEQIEAYKMVNANINGKAGDDIYRHLI